VSSIIYEIFDELPPDERKTFIAHVKAAVQAGGFNLDKLMEAKADSDGIRCPHCNSLEVVKFGKRKGTQRFRCDDCHRTFSSVTGTFLQWTKKPFQTWKTFITSMLDGRSVRKAAKICKVSTKTAFVWRHKVLDALAQYQDKQPRMSGVIEADDTLFRLSFKGGTPEGREAKRRGCHARKPGASKEQVCVSCAVERNGHIFYSKVSALGKPKAEALREVFRNRFSKDAIVCTDGDRAYVRYSKRRRLEHICLKGPLARNGPYHIQNVNGYHHRLKEFIRRFKGVATKYLNNYLVWMNLIQEGGRSRVELLKLAIKALVFDRWSDISNRPAVPVPALVGV